MKLLLLFGDTAVGKMTVGQELARITDLRLFHNHASIETVLEVCGYYHVRAVDRIREAVFEEFARTDEYGLIFTFMWAFDEPSNEEYVEWICSFFRKAHAEIYYVELIASQNERLKRNRSANRLEHKPSKRNVARSEKMLLSDDLAHRFVSNEGELTYENYLRIDNEHLSAAETARAIKERFMLS